MLGFEMFGFEMLGFEMFGFEMLGFEMFGFEMLGLEMFGFEMLGFEMLGFEMLGFEMLGFEMFGLYISSVAMSVPEGAPSGLMSAGLVGSGFSTTKLERPPETRLPIGALISPTLTLILAVVFVETAKRGREMPACAATDTSSMLTTGEGGVGGIGGGPGLLVPGVNEAYPPVGWLAMVRRKLLSEFVKFWTKITNSRWRLALTGFELCGDETARPCVIRLL